jgi:hypothetical protein
MPRKTLRRIAWSIGGAALLAVLLFVLAVADALGFFHDPPLSMERNGPALTAHVERLGEYYCPVGRIRIQESNNGKVVYESIAKREAPEIFNFKLVAGKNPTRLMGDESDELYRVVEPRAESSFTLRPGVPYLLTVWGDSWTFSRTSFVL